MSAKTKPVVFFVAVALIAFGTWFYFTPHFAVRAMKSAAEANDAARLSGYVNFPALKESLKASFNAKIAAEVTRESDGNPFAAFGAALAVAMVNPMIDALVTPESLAMMMKGDKLRPEEMAQRRPSAESEVDTSMAYEGFDRFVVTVRKKGSDEEPIGLVFNRDGMFSWKLSALRLPL
jgi:phosphotransferase system  glucose/maltose/N-acetylglucosamine-specific IIC component